MKKIVTLHEHFATAKVPHAFGGALALAWCTKRARGTIDIDVNVFVSVDRLGVVLAAMPDGVTITNVNRADLERDGQTRLWWEKTPVDVFMNTTEFHEQAATRLRIHEVAGARVPFLGCTDLAVFQVFSDRTRDWADLEEMVAAGSLDSERVLGVLALYLGLDDLRVAKLLALVSQP